MGPLKVLLLLQLFTVPELFAWRLFHRGRESGGNLGRPKSVSQQSNNGNVSVQWFTQKLDHFHSSDTRTWQQRYFVNSEYWNESNAVAFLMIGGEGEATADWMTQGTWVEYAKRFGAICYQLEHRYYGESHPTPDMSVENLKYLSSEQALADIAQFISVQNQRTSIKLRWITFGGSYSGSLSAWVREKYPDLVDVAVASSAPILADVNFLDYFRVVDKSLATARRPGCVANIKKGFDAIYTLFNRGEESVLNNMFQLCDDITKVNSPNDISNFFTDLAGNFAGIVQYNKDNRIGANPKISAITIDTLCDIMTDAEIPSAIGRLAKVNSLLLNASDQTCTDYKYQTMIEELRNETWGGEGSRQWTYQTCAEFGFYQTSDWRPQVFGHSFPIAFSIQQCIDIFGPEFNASRVNRAVQTTNANYGGLHYNTSATIFVQGSIDPWHVLGIDRFGSDASAIAGYYGYLIDGTAHCADMYPARPSDSNDLWMTRLFIYLILDYYIRGE